MSGGLPFFSFKTSIRAVAQKVCILLYIDHASVCELAILSQLLACFFTPCSVALLGGWVGHHWLCFHETTLNWCALSMTCPGLLSDWLYGQERPCMAACLCRMTFCCDGQGGVHLFWICLTCSSSLDTFSLTFPRPESITVLLWLHFTCTFHSSEALDIEQV